ncbi:MAG: hypothetical protein WCK63_15610 [Betaproteobacteria bacterium]
MPSPKNHLPIEEMQAIAWCAEVMRVSGRTAKELEGQGFDPSGKIALEFSLYSRGRRLPSDNTLDLLEEKYPATKAIFQIGPDTRTLWGLLSDECDEELCQEVFDDWLFTGFNQRDVASVPKAELDSIISQHKSSSFQDKTDLAWKKMVGPNEVDFDLFDAGKEPHCMSEPSSDRDAFLNELEASGIQIEKPLNIEALLKSPLLNEKQKDELKQLSDYFHAMAPKLDDVIGIIALRRLAESRRECQSEARYLFLGILPFINGIFFEWNIGSHLRTFLSSWSDVPTSPSVIASANQITAGIVKALRAESGVKHSAKETKVITTMLNRFKR